MSFWERKSQILGINARNLLYINRFNSRADKSFADDKIFTKNYLQSRGVGTARLFAVLRNYKELDNFDPGSLPEKFVIKPNRGFGGEGIIIVRGRKGALYLGTGTRRYRWKDLYRECGAILDGRYAISGFHDQVIFEELLESDEYFTRLGTVGLPDLRLLVFNGVPVIAMLRLPTAESGGKANLHLGALSVGIDIRTGRGTHGMHKNRVVRILPSGLSVRDVQIPKWDDVLLTAARVQQISRIGYLAVDIVLTKTGIKILELNARAGLSVQLANQVPLKPRLHKVQDLNVGTPEEGVRIAKTLFSKRASSPEHRLAGKSTIGLYETVELLNTNHAPVLVKIDPHAKKNLVDEQLRPILDGGLIEIKLSGKRLALPVEFGNFQNHTYRIILAGKYLGDFLIDVNASPEDRKRAERTKPSKSKEEKIIINVDRRISELDRKLAILPYFRPINLMTEQKIFFTNPTYSPRFIYKKLTVDLDTVAKELKKVPRQVDHPLMPLYLEKMKEITLKIGLLRSRGTERISYYSERVYGRVSKELFEQATRFVTGEKPAEDASPLLAAKQIQRMVERYLGQCKLTHWKVVIAEGQTTDMATSRQNLIKIRKGAEFSENRLQALLAHEVETHVFRLENGRRQRYQLFTAGTAGYVATEEGLAIYNQSRLPLDLGDKALWPAYNVIGTYQGRLMSFAELFHHLTTTYAVTPELAWKVCVKVKRGLADTEVKAVFVKDAVYFAGFRNISEYVKRFGESGLRELYVGKIGLSDLSLLRSLPDWPDRWPAKLVPGYR